MGNNFILQGAVGINEPHYYIQTTVQYLVVSSQDNSIVRKTSVIDACCSIILCLPDFCLNC